MRRGKREREFIARRCVLPGPASRHGVARLELPEVMSIFVKPKLKALKECLAVKDWEGVQKNAE